jgi:hypothetical protein
MIQSSTISKGCTMKFSTKTRVLLISLVVISLAITGCGVFADESNPVYSGSPVPALNAVLLSPDHGQSSGSLSIVSPFTTLSVNRLNSGNYKGVAGNFSSILPFVPATSSLVTEVKESRLFNTLQKSYQAHPPSQYYFDSSPLYCSGGF